MSHVYNVELLLLDHCPRRTLSGKLAVSLASMPTRNRTSPGLMVLDAGKHEKRDEREQKLDDAWVGEAFDRVAL